MRMCAELADLGMQLARAVAARALSDWQEPEAAAFVAAPEPSPAPQGQPTHIRTPSCKTPSCKPVDPALLFTRLAAAVRECIALEARLAGGTQAASRAPAPLRGADPRRAPLRDIFRLVTKNHPDRAALLRETTNRVDEELAADAGQTTQAPSIFFAICEEFGIEIDFATLPDLYLNALCDGIDPEDDVTVTPEPRATSPP